MLKQFSQVSHHFGQDTRLFSHADHADVELVEQPRMLGFNDAARGSAFGLQCLVSKRVHSCKSPEDTLSISSSVVIPAAAFCKASWCMVTMVFWDAALSSSFDRFWRIISLRSGLIG